MLLFNLGVDLVVLFVLDTPNTWFYNIIAIINTCFSLLIISKLYQRKSYFRFGLVLSLIFIIAGTLNYLYGQGTKVLNTYTIIPFYLVLGMYSYIILRKNILDDLKITPIGLGFLVANLIYFVISATVLAALPLTNNIDLEISMKLFRINQVAYCFWGISITIGFIWTKN